MAEVMTVRGPVQPNMLGRTLPHEHLLIDLARVTRNFDHFLHDVSLATIEARHFRDAGGATIVDLTNRNLGRDPRGLCAIAERTGLNIVMGCGWYREPSRRSKRRPRRPLFAMCWSMVASRSACRMASAMASVWRRRCRVRVSRLVYRATAVHSWAQVTSLIAWQR